MTSIFGRISSRRVFFDYLNKAIDETDQLLAKSPGRWPLVESIRMQLEGIREWTKDGRDPTLEERSMINIVVTLVREMDGVADPAALEYKDLVSDVAMFFEYWPNDDRLGVTEDSAWLAQTEHEVELAKTRLAKLSKSERRKKFGLDAVVNRMQIEFEKKKGTRG